MPTRTGRLRDTVRGTENNYSAISGPVPKRRQIKKLNYEKKIIDGITVLIQKHRGKPGGRNKKRDILRIEPKKNSTTEYILLDDILKIHGKDWFGLFEDLIKFNNLIEPENDKKGISFWEYKNYANIIDFGTQT